MDTDFYPSVTLKAQQFKALVFGALFCSLLVGIPEWQARTLTLYFDARYGAQFPQHRLETSKESTFLSICLAWLGASFTICWTSFFDARLYCRLFLCAFVKGTFLHFVRLQAYRATSGVLLVNLIHARNAALSRTNSKLSRTLGTNQNYKQKKS